MRMYEEDMVGVHIRTVAEKIVKLAHQYNEPVMTDFNGIDIMANPGDTPESIVIFFNRQRDIHREKYKNSPQGKEDARLDQVRTEEKQKKANDLMRKLQDIDFTHEFQALDWLCKMQAPSDWSNVKIDKELIIKTFADHGFHPGVNCDNDFNENDCDNVKRFIIGQALNTLNEVGAIHHLVTSFTEDWKKKFFTKLAS